MDTENQNQSSRNSPQLPEGFERCIELTKGYDRASPEQSLIFMLHFLRILLIFIWFGWIIVITFTAGDFEQDLFSVFTVFLIIIVQLILLYFWLLSENIELTSIQINKLYYRIPLILEKYMADDEKVLVSVLVSNQSPFARLHKPMSCGFLVLTSHRGFILTTISTLLILDKMLLKPNSTVIETFDFSYPPAFLRTYDLKNPFSRLISKRYSIIPDSTDEPEIWFVMPTESNNYRLLDAILEKRDRIE